MSAKIVFTDSQLKELRQQLFDHSNLEKAAFILCGQSQDSGVLKLVCHSIVPIDNDDYLIREPDRLTITSRPLMRVAKYARQEGFSIVFAHSHPNGFPHFSTQDDREEERLIPFFQSRIPDRIHGTVVLSDNSISGRLYAPKRLNDVSILIIGDRIKIESFNGSKNSTNIFDRQVRAFGSNIQSTLSTLHVGIVGLGGTGSPLAEQLYRLGIGKLTLFDGDILEETNLNRVYGSTLSDIGEPKVEITKRHLDRIGLGIPIHAVAEHITNLTAAKTLTDCDVIFSCTDKQIPRAILIQVVIRYLIPVFDLGVLIDSQAGEITGIHGRVTTLLPGESCLLCRGRISPEMMRIEALSPEERKHQIKEGYAPELEEPAPAVISFTSAIASAAVSEFLHRLTGFMGRERKSSEILYSFDESRIRTNRVPQRDTCICTDVSILGRGDENPFLGMVWPNRTILDDHSATKNEPHKS